MSTRKRQHWSRIKNGEPFSSQFFHTLYSSALHRSYPLRHHLGNIPDPDIGSAGILDTILEHCHTVGASDTDSIGLLLEGFVDSGDIDPLAAMLFHPHPPATGAAAETVLPVLAEFLGSFTGHFGNDFPWLGINVVMPAEVAGVMVDDAAKLCYLPVRLYFTLCKEFLQQLGMVDDFDLQTILAIVILERTEAVRTLGDDLGDLLCGEELDIFSGHFIKEVFVAEPPGTVAAALLFLAEYPPA